MSSTKRESIKEGEKKSAISTSLKIKTLKSFFIDPNFFLNQKSNFH